jgi:Arc/MetJ-type ribon-helix-helix transcriptional regulator
MKQRIQVSLNPELVEEAKAMLKQRKFDSLSEYLEALIRDEYESQIKNRTVEEKPANLPPANNPSSAVSSVAPMEVIIAPELDRRLTEHHAKPSRKRKTRP